MRSVLASLVLVVVMATPAAANHTDDRDCGSFGSQAAAQQHLREHPGDPDRLDENNPPNGIACESHRYPAGSAQDLTPVSAATTAPTLAASPTTVPQAAALAQTGTSSMPLAFVAAWLILMGVVLVRSAVEQLVPARPRWDILPGR